MKKILGIFLLSLLIIQSSYAGTCKTPKNPKEKFVLAPEPVPYTRKSPTNRIEEVLSKRKTINVFRAWHNNFGKTENYGMTWAGNPVSISKNRFSYAFISKQQEPNAPPGLSEQSYHTRDIREWDEDW